VQGSLWGNFTYKAAFSQPGKIGFQTNSNWLSHQQCNVTASQCAPPFLSRSWTVRRSSFKETSFYLAWSGAIA
jgi:hypothetical protein